MVVLVSRRVWQVEEGTREALRSTGQVVLGTENQLYGGCPFRPSYSNDLAGLLATTAFLQAALEVNR